MDPLTTSWIIVVLIIVFFIITMWKIFTKAWEAGWKCLIPIYNTIILLKIAGKPWWWVLLMIIPLVGIVVAIIVFVELAKKFGKGTGFAVWLMLLWPIFFPILAFGSAEYIGNQSVASDWWDEKLY